MTTSTIPITVRLNTTFSADAFAKYVNEWMKDVFTTTKINNFKINITGLLRAAIKNSVEASETTQSLRNPAGLWAEFGYPDSSYINNLVDYVTNLIDISMTELPNTSTGKFRAALSINFGDIDYSVLLAQPFASYISYNSKGEETQVPWLEWLLLRGTEPILQDWMIIYPGTRRKTVKQSRTSYALMRKITTGGKPWSVPAEYAGTVTDNFITRAINDVQVWFAKSLEQEVQNIFK